MRQWTVGDVVTTKIVSVWEDAPHKKIVRRTAAGIAARLVAGVPGVVAVVDRLTWDFDDVDESRTGYYRSHPFSSSDQQPR